MTLKLDPSQAPAKLVEVESLRQTAVQALKNIQDVQSSMLASGWQGNSATKYGNLSSTQHDDVTQIINYLNQIVDTAEGQIKAVASADQG
jgi:uncharacterized protein YukE